jgi:hypothetical protein
MIRTTILLLTAALTLIMSALAAQAADIQISSLPFNITAPGRYVLASDLTWSDQTGNSSAITVLFVETGSVVIDLKGHTLTGGNTGIVVRGDRNSVSTTIKNGTLKGFQFAIAASIVNWC